MQGHWSEGRRWLEAALAQGGDVEPGVRALFGAGSLAQNQEDHARAHALYEESLALFRELGDARYVAFILFFLGGTAMEQGDPERARVLYEESLDMA